MSAGFGPPPARLVSAGLALVVCGSGLAVSVQAENRQEPSGATRVRLRAIGAGSRPGRAAAVVVEEGALVHSALLYPLDAQARLQGAGDAYAQATYVLGSLDTALRAAGTGLDRLARLHVYVADASVSGSRSAARRALQHHRARRDDRRVANAARRRARGDGCRRGDGSPQAVGTSERIVVAGLRPTAGGGAHVAVQPEGPFVIVSGRAAPGEFEAAVRATMEQLRADLQGVGLGFDHVVQVKAFLGDMARAEQLQRLVAGAFQGTAPPQVVTEWRDASLPVEIEVVATAPGAAGGGERLSFVEPIRRYSRVARVFAGRPIFVSGLTGASADPAAQVREVFGELRRLLAAAGSDMRHLVKATYYVSDKAADQEINTIRPSVYDAARPPAASKISVQGTGRPGRARSST